jgi:hypothetical protein
MRSDGGGATDRRPRAIVYNGTYTPIHSLSGLSHSSVRLVVWVPRDCSTLHTRWKGRCCCECRGARLGASQHVRHMTIVHCPQSPGKKRAGQGMSKDKPYTSKNEGNNRYNSRVFTLHRDAFTRAVCSPPSRIQVVCSFYNQPKLFPSFFFSFSLYLLLESIHTATSPKLARAASDPPPQATLAHFLTSLHTVALHTAATKQAPSPHTDYKNERTSTSSILSLLST